LAPESYLGGIAFFCSRLFSAARWQLDLGRVAPNTQTVQRTCQAWVLDLTQGAGAAHERALAELRDFLRRTLGRAFGRELGPGDLDDLTQESLLRIHECLPTFEERSGFTTWAAAIAVNCAYSELRRRRHHHVSLDEAIEQGVSALGQQDGLEREQREAELRAAIDSALTVRQREAVLALLGGLPLAEIARRSSTSQGAIYKLLHDARRRLKHHLEGQDAAAPLRTEGDVP
jgi:RNA polymerase sigma-70 factor (ECF subfamily)